MRRLIPSFGASKRPAPSKTAETGVIVRRSLPRARLIAWAVFGVMSASMAGYVAMDYNRVQGELITLTADAGLNLQHIEVKGRAHTPQDILLAVTELQRGQPIFAISLPELHQRITEIGWVEDVVVERRMPSTIRITLQERMPVALLQTAKGHELIDGSGAVIRDADTHAFTHLKVVSGTAAAQRAGGILDILRTEPELFANVWAISLQSERRWDVHLRNGITIHLPESDPRTAWSRLAIMDHKKQIIGRDIAVIDLRIPEQLIVEPNIPVRGKGRNT